MILLGRRALRSRYAWMCFDKLFYGLLVTYIRIFLGLLGEYAVDLRNRFFRKSWNV
jgi:hypothetical protein